MKLMKIFLSGSEMQQS